MLDRRSVPRWECHDLDKRLVVHDADVGYLWSEEGKTLPCWV